MIQLVVLALTLTTLPLGDPGLAGQVVTIDGDPTRYYVAANGHRYSFPDWSNGNQPANGVFESWYANDDGVLMISRTELEMLPIGGNVTFRPASKLVGTVTDSRVFVVTAGAVLREIATDHAARLFGAEWSNHFTFIPDVFFVNYQVGRPYTELAHPESLVFRYADTPVVYLMDGGSVRPINAAIMAENGFRQENIFTIPAELRYRISAPVDRREERLTTPAGPIHMFTRGEANNVLPSNLSDAINGLSYLFLGGPAPGCFDAADIDDNGSLNITDPVALLNFLFLGGPAPAFPGISLVGDSFHFDPTPDQLTCGCFRCDVPQLEVEAAPLPIGTVLAGAKEAVIGRFTFTLRNFPGRTFRSVTFELTLSRRGTSTATLDYLHNIKVVDTAGRLIAGPVEPQRSGETVEDSNGTVTFTDNPWFVLPDNPQTFAVIADVSAATPAGDLISVSILPTLGLTTIEPTLFGPNTTVSSASRSVATSGHLEIKFVPDSASAGYVAGLVNDVQLGDLTARASNENIRIERIDFTGVRTNPDVTGGAWGQLRSLKLYHFATLVAQTIPISDGGLTDVEERLAVLDLNPPVVIPANSLGVFRVTVDTERVSRYGPNPGPGYAGQGLQIRIADAAHVRATGLQSGTRATVDVSQAELPPMTVCVAVPTVSLNEDLPATDRLEPTRLRNATFTPIYRYRVAADQTADLALYQSCLRITTIGGDNLRLDNLQLVDTNLRIRANGQLAVERTDGSMRIKTYRFIFDDGAGNPQPLVVSAGTAVTVTTHADTSGVEQGSVLIVQFLGDDGFPAVYPVPTTTVADRICFPPCQGSGHFVWGDLAYSGPLGVSDPRILTDPQWYNGHRVRTPTGHLPIASHPLTFSNE